jgi:hypothetical protein
VLALHTISKLSSTLKAFLPIGVDQQRYPSSAATKSILRALLDMSKVVSEMAKISALYVKEKSKLIILSSASSSSSTTKSGFEMLSEEVDMSVDLAVMSCTIVHDTLLDIAGCTFEAGDFQVLSLYK